MCFVLATVVQRFFYFIEIICKVATIRCLLRDTGRVSYRRSDIRQVPRRTVKRSECPTVGQWDVLFFFFFFLEGRFLF